MPLRRVNATSAHLRLLAQLMQAEARGEGRRGQELVGSVLVNRVVADCKPDFNNIRTIPQAIYGKYGPSRSPFEPVQNGEIYKMRPSAQDLRRARQLANGRIDSLTRRMLWFYNPTPWKSTRGPCGAKMPRSPKTRFEFAFKNHCFYTGTPGYCPEFL